MKYNDDGVKVANNIRAERSRAKITIEDTSNYLGISKPTYVSFEKDASNIKAKYLIMLANLFNCDISSFFIQ